MNFNDQAKQFVQSIQTRKRNPVKPATVAKYEACLKHALPLFGNRDLSQVNNSDLKVLVKMLSDDGLSASTITGVAVVVKLVVASAVNEQGEELYPRSWNSEFMDLPVVNPSTQTAPIATREGVQQALGAAKGQNKALYALLAGTGLRVGEILALTVSDWDRQNMTLSVTKTVVKGHIQDSTKTNAGTRLVDLTQELNGFLIQNIHHTDGLMFRSASGGVVRQMSAYDSLEKVGIPGFHSLRRFRATHLENAGVPRMLTKFWLGHSASDISEKYMKFGADVESRKTWCLKAGLGFEL
jgi:integrase